MRAAISCWQRTAISAQDHPSTAHKERCLLLEEVPHSRVQPPMVLLDIRSHTLCLYRGFCSATSYFGRLAPTVPGLQRAHFGGKSALSYYL